MYKMTTEEKAILIEKCRGRSLADLRPDLAKEWHPTKNGDLTPEMVSRGSDKNVWWFLHYNDTKTRKYFDFEWKDSVSHRISGRGCPILSGKVVYPKFNDLTTTSPKLAAEWHPTKNGDLTPKMVTLGSNKKVWWYLPYDDPKTGKHFDFEWEASVLSRKNGYGCPFISGQAVWPGFNDLATTHPELTKEWHPTKNGDLTPEMISQGSRQKVWWYLPYDDPKTGKRFDFEWEAIISNRSKGYGCPFVNKGTLYRGFNDLATVNPKLAAEWHPIKNGDLSPKDVTAHSDKKVWWLFPYDDPKTGKHFDFEWKDAIAHRAEGRGCPFISGQAVWLGFNDLATVSPKLAAEWHPTKNGDLTPETVSAGSGKKVWWYLPYNDPETGKHFGFEWEATIVNRTRQRGCPFLNSKAILQGFNDIATTNPKLAKEWHATKNGNVTPYDVTRGANKKIWWQCANGHEWFASVHSRANGNGCPCCSVSKGEQRMFDFLDKHGVYFVSEHTFSDCVYRGKLRFDCALFDKNGNLAFLVEYDGEQHFKPIDFSGRGGAKDVFLENQIRDNIKNEYCRKNRIPLVRISYKDCDNIEKILLKKMVRYGLM